MFHWRSDVAVSPATLASSREQLVAILERALSGDRLAAEYTLCNLVSSVHARLNVIALGKFALNLCRVPPGGGYAAKLYALIERLVTKVFAALSFSGI